MHPHPQDGSLAATMPFGALVTQRHGVSRCNAVGLGMKPL